MGYLYRHYWLYGGYYIGEPGALYIFSARAIINDTEDEAELQINNIPDYEMGNEIDSTSRKESNILEAAVPYLTEITTTNAIKSMKCKHIICYFIVSLNL